MKDTAISYDIVHQQQQQQQQQQPTHHSWNQQRQQTHTTSVYANQSTQQHSTTPTSQSQQQRSAINQHVATQQQQQQLGQYQHHQQLQSTAHHNQAPALAAYYQQAHMYPTYQAHAHSQQQQQDQQQQQSGNAAAAAAADQQQHHHQVSSVPVTGTSSSGLGNAPALAAAAAANHAAPVHHPQAPNNTQNPALNHAGWSQPGVAGSMAPQPHHAVVTDHQTLAYMTHAYQSHNTSVSDHHRNSNGPMSNQPIGSQASSYTVDPLYNSSAAAAAAVAAYGYNNYNAAAFFQTSNNGPHTQTGHPSPANISTFWNHNQAASQQRPTHSQPVTNQASVQRQPVGSADQAAAAAAAANYMHDPRIYYGRPAYNQGMQNFGQAQHHSQTQPQADVIHHRMSAALSQQHQLLQHHEQQLAQAHQHHHHHHQQQQQHQQLHHQSPVGGLHQTASSQGHQTVIGQPQHPIPQNQLGAANQAATTSTHTQNSRQLSSSIKVSPQHQIPKTAGGDVENLAKSVGHTKNHLDYDEMAPSTQQTTQILQQNPQIAHQTSQQSANDLDVNLTSTKNSQLISNAVKDQTHQSAPSSSLSPVNKNTNSPPVIKSDPSAQYQRKPQTNAVTRNLYRTTHDDRDKNPSIDAVKKSALDRDLSIRNAAGSEGKTNSTRQQDSDQTTSLEDGLASVSISSSRKTTWASIASQPAKVSQPKSLKSKIAGSNSVLSSAKHLAAVALDTSSLESKNGINPAIKSSVSAAATSIQRSSVPPPVSKVPAAVASLKLDLLGEESLESSKISWPAVNASVNITLDDTPLKETVPSNASLNQEIANDKQKKDEVYSRNREYREPIYKDHNHNQGSNAKMVNSYHRDFWNRREQRDYRVRRDSDRKEPSESDKQAEPDNDDSRDMMNSRRDFKASNTRTNHFRGEEQYRDRGDYNKRNIIPDRNEPRGNDGYQNSRYPVNRYDSRDSRDVRDSRDPRDSRESQHLHNNQSMHGSRHNDNHTQHHHYNNIRDGNTAGNSLSKLDLNLHPHLNPANFNPKTFNLEPVNAKYFIIKSYSEDDIHRSIKYSIWCSTNHGNKRLDEAYRQQQAKDGPIYLFFSVNGSGHFCGMAQMMSSVDFDSSSGVWAQSKWQGEFSVKWIYVKDVPNSALRHITLENNEDKPVTNSRDTQEVPSEKGKAVLKILHQYPHTTSIFDDFLHYERRQEEEKFKKSHLDQPPNRSEERERGGGNVRFGRPYMNPRPHNDFHGNRDRSSRFAS